MTHSLCGAVFERRIEKPRKFSPEELEQFATLVAKGGKVSIFGWIARVGNAQLLAMLRGADGQLLATAGLKHPVPAYRERVSIKAGVHISRVSHPLELGWVMVQPSAQGGKSSFLRSALLGAAPN